MRRLKIITVELALLAAGLQFIAGPGYRGPFPDFVNGYLMDILLSLIAYLLTQIALRERLTLKLSRLLGADTVFFFGILVEMLQKLDIPFLGSTFDPMDIFCYAFGVGLGLAVDVIVTRTNVMTLSGPFLFLQ